MFRILLFIVLQFILLGGIGALFQRLVWKRQALGVFPSFWLGLAVVLALGQVAQLFVPLNDIALIIMLVLGLIGCRWWVPQAWQTWCRITAEVPRKSYAFIFALLLALLSFGLLSRIALPKLPMNDDTAIYHLNAVRWMNEYPAVPGLAHLHDRLGFNSSYLLYAAIVNNGPLEGRTAWVMPGFLVLVATAQLLGVLFFDRRRESLAARIFALISLIYVVKIVWNIFPSLHYDRSMLLLQFILILEILRSMGGLWSRKSGNTANLPSAEQLTYFTVLAVITATFKLPGAFVLFLTVVWITALLLWKEDRFSLKPGVFREALAIFWMPGLVLFGWMARNVVLSGWLLYPAPIGNLHLQWSIAPETVERLLQRVRSWGRMPGTSQDIVWNGSFWDWFTPWQNAHYRTIEKDLLWLGALALLVWLLRRQRGATKLKLRVDAFLVTLAGVNLFMWFRSSPDMRFGDGYFWMWGALCTALLLSEGLVRTTRALPVALGFAAYLLCSVKADIVPTKDFRWWKIDRAKSAEMTEQVLDNGQQPPLKIYVPANGNHSGDSPLPTTAYPNNLLLMREPGNLRAGFYKLPVEGKGTTKGQRDEVKK
jgi:hypothetical protein